VCTDVANKLRNAKDLPCTVYSRSQKIPFFYISLYLSKLPLSKEVVNEGHPDSNHFNSHLHSELLGDQHLILSAQLALSKGLFPCHICFAN
jgi:hypothetical protein